MNFPRTYLAAKNCSAHPFLCHWQLDLMTGYPNKKLGPCCSVVGCSLGPGTNLLSEIKVH